MIDGFVLLKNSFSLKNKLNDLRTEMRNSPPLGPLTSLISEQDAQVETELSLLLEGFVEDHQVFQSFGYENLYEQGYLSYDRWKTFQCSSSHLTIDRLDSAFHAVSVEVRSPLHLSMATRHGSATTVKLLLEDGYDPNALDPLVFVSVSVPLVEAIKHNNQEIVALLIDHGADVDGRYSKPRHSPLIAALEKGNTGAITKLLSCGVDLKILGKVAVADRWRFATTLLEHGISADSILKILPESDAVDKRLLCVLFDSGGDVIKVPDCKPLTQKARFSWPAAPSFTEAHHMKFWRFESNNATEASHSSASFTESASRADDGLEAGFDSHCTKELRRIYDQTRGLVHAVRMRDAGSVDLHIQNGANSTFGLTAALQTHDLRTLKLLLDTGADLDYVAAPKAESALMAAVEAGDRDFVKSLLEVCATSNLLRDLDFILDGQTPLMVAVLRNDVHIAQTLMGMGANPTFATNGGNCFTMARKNGFNDMLQTLLRGTRVSPPSGDSLSRTSKAPSSYSTFLSQFTSGSLSELAILAGKKWYSELAYRTQEDQQKFADHCLREIQLRNLRLEFRKQHSHITACAGVSALVHQPQPDRGKNPLAWGHGFDTDHSKAWNSGTAVMRRLCDG